MTTIPHHGTKDVWICTGQDKVPETVRSVKIAESMTAIPDETFQELEELREVTLSSSVQVIGKSAFCGCKKLKSILCLRDEKVQVIGKSPFCGCKKLKSILYQCLRDDEKEEFGIPSNVR
eukprot:scaffold4528_cov69-Cylindrotheca_fusiformis.AAC.2